MLNLYVFSVPNKLYKLLECSDGFEVAVQKAKELWGEASTLSRITHKDFFVGGRAGTINNTRLSHYAKEYGGDQSFKDQIIAWFSTN